VQAALKQRQADIFFIQLGHFRIALTSSMSSWMNVDRMLEPIMDPIARSL
jgi:hypothetical protein